MRVVLERVHPGVDDCGTPGAEAVPNRGVQLVERLDPAGPGTHGRRGGCEVHRTVAYASRRMAPAGLGHVALRLSSWDQRGQLKRFLGEVAPALTGGR